MAVQTTNNSCEEYFKPISSTDKLKFVIKTLSTCKMIGSII